MGILDAVVNTVQAVQTGNQVQTPTTPPPLPTVAAPPATSVPTTVTPISTADTQLVTVPQEARNQDPLLSDAEKPKAGWIWVKDTTGYPSVSVTLVAVSFWVTTLMYLISAVEKIGSVSIRPFDVGAAGVYFTPILALYFGRRFTDAKFNVNQNKK